MLSTIAPNLGIATIASRVILDAMDSNRADQNHSACLRFHARNDEAKLDSQSNAKLMDCLDERSILRVQLSAQIRAWAPSTKIGSVKRQRMTKTRAPLPLWGYGYHLVPTCELVAALEEVLNHRPVQSRQRRHTPALA